MKKLKNIICTLAFTSLFFTGCYNAVFDGINNDVETEERTVSGVVTQITRYTAGDGKEYLVCNADGGIRYKEASNRSHGSWKTYDHLPFSLHSYDYYGSKHNGEQIIQVLADSTNLYVLSCEYFDDDDEGTVAPRYIKLRTAAISDWDASDPWTLLNTSSSEDKSQIFKVYKNSTSGYYYSAFYIFSTNSINPEYRHVYVRSGRHGAWYDQKSNIEESEIETPVYYEITPSKLNEITIPKVWDGSSEKEFSTAYDICSAAYFNDKVNFFTSPAVITNEHYSSENPYQNVDTAAYVDPTCVYWGSGSTVYYITDLAATSTKTSIDTSRNVSALAVCKDSILIGMGNTSAYSTSSYGGFARAPLNNYIPTSSSTKDFSTNADTQISSGYIVSALLNANPAENELESALYAGVFFYGSGSSTAVSYSSIGLWSYYPDPIRGNWNQE